MQVRDVMTKDVQVIHAATSVRDAARKMKELNVGILPVAEKQKIVGVLTDRDIVVRSTAEGLNPEKEMIGSLMSGNVIWCFEDEDIDSAIDKMKKAKIRRIPVVSRENELVGIISIGDVAIEGDERRAGETLEQISHPNRPNR